MFLLLCFCYLKKFVDDDRQPMILSNECYNPVEGLGRSYVDSNVLIRDCSFFRIGQINDKGGVIFIQNGHYYMNISCSLFYYCISKDVGGAIFFESSSSFLDMICAKSCKSNQYGQFADISATSVIISYLSISNCSDSTVGYHSFRFVYGEQSLFHTNSSMNKAWITSGIYFDDPNQVDCSWCSFSHNHVSDYSCILFYGTKSFSISYINVLNNNSPQKGVLHVRNGNFAINNGIYFQNSGTLFHSEDQKSLTLSNSYIDHIGTIAQGPVFTSINNSFSYAPSYCIKFYQTYHCNTDFPIIQRNTVSTGCRIQFIFLFIHLLVH